MAVEAEDLGEHELKNIPRPVRVFRVRPRCCGDGRRGTAAARAP